MLGVTAGCAGSGATEKGPGAAPSPSPSPSATCAGVPIYQAGSAIRERSRFDTGGDLHILKIKAGEPICGYESDPDPRPGVTITMTFVRHGKPGTRAEPLQTGEPVGRYDGRTPLEIPVPVLGNPCLGAVIHVGPLDPDVLPASSPIGGVRNGPRIYSASDLFGSDAFALYDNPIIAVDDVSGPACDSEAVKPR